VQQPQLSIFPVILELPNMIMKFRKYLPYCFVIFATLQISCSSPESEKGIVFKSAADVSSDGNKLSGGADANTLNWPSVLDTETCTAVLIGPRTIFTAGHCVDAGYASDETLPVKMQWFGKSIDLDCEMSPEYTKDPNFGGLRNINDHALCYSAEEIIKPQPANPLNAIKTKYIYETLDISGRLSQPNQHITMVGFGCYNLTPKLVESRVSPGRFLYWINLNCDFDTDGPFIRRLRVGHDKLNAYNATLDGDSPPKIYNTAVRLVNYSTGTSKEPALCKGDSGGPVFSGHSPLAPGDIRGRRVIGVNSTIDMTTLYPAGEVHNPSDYNFISAMAGVANQGFISFMEDWAKRNNAKLCLSGYNGRENIISGSNMCRP